MRTRIVGRCEDRASIPDKDHSRCFSVCAFGVPRWRMVYFFEGVITELTIQAH